MSAYGALQTGSYTNKTSSANIVPRDGAMLGFYVNSTSSGTITFYDSATTTTGTPISGTITPAIGWHSFPVNFANGLYAVIGSTLNVTIVTV
jgi:hypothetical protein